MTKTTSSMHTQIVGSQPEQSAQSKKRSSISKNYKGYEIILFPKKTPSRKSKKWGLAVKSHARELLPMDNHHIYDNPAVAFTAAMALVDDQGE